MGGRQFEVSEDTAIAVFPTAKRAALAAVALLTVVATHEWPHKRDVAVSVSHLRASSCGIHFTIPCCVESSRSTRANETPTPVAAFEDLQLSEVLRGDQDGTVVASPPTSRRPPRSR